MNLIFKKETSFPKNVIFWDILVAFLKHMPYLLNGNKEPLLMVTKNQVQVTRGTREEIKEIEAHKR